MTPKPPSPFSRLYAQARRGGDEDKALLDALGAFYTSRALVKPRRFNSGFGGGTLTDLPARKERTDAH